MIRCCVKIINKKKCDVKKSSKRLVYPILHLSLQPYELQTYLNAN